MLLKLVFASLPDVYALVTTIQPLRRVLDSRQMRRDDRKSSPSIGHIITALRNVESPSKHPRAVTQIHT